MNRSGRDQRSSSDDNRDGSRSSRSSRSRSRSKSSRGSIRSRSGRKIAASNSSRSIISSSCIIRSSRSNRRDQPKRTFVLLVQLEYAVPTSCKGMVTDGVLPHTGSAEEYDAHFPLL
jgi:hypothetical protein